MNITRKYRLTTKLAASRSKLVMEALLKGGKKDRGKAKRLLEQMREGVNKSRAEKLPEDASFTEVYRAMQEAPEVSKSSLELKDSLARSVVKKLDKEKKPLQVKPGLTTSVRPGKDWQGARYTLVTPTKKNPSSKPHEEHKIRAYVGKDLPHGEVYASLRHEFDEAIDATPSVRDRLTQLSKKELRKRNKRNVKKGIILDSERASVFEARKQGKRAKRFYPKGQGRRNKNIDRVLGHYSVNPLLGERVHTAGKTTVDRSADTGGVPKWYARGSEKAEQILRNVGNVGGYTPPPRGRAAGKANIQLERALENPKSLKKSLKRQAKRSGPIRGDMGN